MKMIDDRNSMGSKTKISKGKIVWFLAYIILINSLLVYTCSKRPSSSEDARQVLKSLQFIFIMIGVGGAFAFFSDIFVKMEEKGIGFYSLTRIFGLKNTPAVYIIPGIITLLIAIFYALNLITTYSMQQFVEYLLH